MSGRDTEGGERGKRDKGEIENIERGKARYRERGE